MDQAGAASVCSLQSSKSRCQSGAPSDLVPLLHKAAYGKHSLGSGFWKTRVSACTQLSVLNWALLHVSQSLLCSYGKGACGHIVDMCCGLMRLHEAKSLCQLRGQSHTSA